MKKILGLLFISSFLIFGCKKQNTQVLKCDVQTEINKTSHLIQYDFTAEAANFIDTFAKYPQLQIFRLINDPYVLGVHCHVYYEEIQILNEGYRLFKSKNTGETLIMDTITLDINIALTPTLPSKEAIRIAESVLDYQSTCISYQLGIYDINGGQGMHVKDYKLVWKITPTGDSSRRVILDAHTGKTYSKQTGIVE